LVLPDVASAGAAASLIFLISFSLAHWIGILIRKRIGAGKIPFRVPWFPLVPAIGIVASIALAVYQGVVVPLAGLIVLAWLIIGSFLYIILFRRRARVFDALSEALDPQLVKLRGRLPIVLVPISNPTNAGSMIALANSLVPPSYGRVLLLSVVSLPENAEKENYTTHLVNSQKVLKEALSASFEEGLSPEALTTIAPDVWDEIKRVSRQYSCTSLLLGLSNLSENVEGANLEKLISSVDCDVVVLRAPSGWKLSDVNRILVPVGGKGQHGELLARLLGSLCRTSTPEIDFIRVVPEKTSWQDREKARDELFRLAQDQVVGSKFKVRIIQNDDAIDEIIRQSLEADLVILGLQRIGKKSAFGQLALGIARNTSCPLILISHTHWHGYFY
jgi:nucleotide-binding universal stress UspA family protein